MKAGNGLLGKTNPQTRPFKELVNGLGHLSQLEGPKYVDSTKLMNGFVWGRYFSS